MAETKTLTLWLHSCIQVSVDAEELETIKTMVAKAGGKTDARKLLGPINDLISRGCNRERAMKLCLLAQQELFKNDN